MCRDRVRKSHLLALRFTFQDHDLVRRVGALLVSGLVLTACSGSGHHASSSVSHPRASTPTDDTASGTLGSITGHLFAVGGVVAGPRPLSGRVEVVGPGATWRDITVGTDGVFRITTTVGTYSLTGTSPLYDAGHGVCRAQQAVRVASGETSIADVLCQEK
jgi:hypothetical protein